MPANDFAFHSPSSFIPDRTSHFEAVSSQDTMGKNVHSNQSLVKWVSHAILSLSRAQLNSAEQALCCTRTTLSI